MKQLKFLVVALTLLMGISLTSCIGEADPTVTNITFGQITSMYPTVIDTPAGIKFTAVNDLSGQDLFLGDYVYFQYSYNSDEQIVDQNTKKINASIVIGEKISSRGVVVTSDKGEEYENVTMLQVGNGAGTNLQFLYYDKDRLIIPAFFLYKESLSGHSFTLCYDETTVKSGDKEIKFYLRHNSTEASPTKAALSYKIFNIQEALAHFKSVAGGIPTKVVIYVNETNVKTSDALKDKKEELTEYSVQYAFTE